MLKKITQLPKFVYRLLTTHWALTTPRIRVMCRCKIQPLPLLTHTHTHTENVNYGSEFNCLKSMQSKWRYCVVRFKEYWLMW